MAYWLQNLLQFELNLLYLVDYLLIKGAMGKKYTAKGRKSAQAAMVAEGRKFVYEATRANRNRGLINDWRAGRKTSSGLRIRKKKYEKIDKSTLKVKKETGRNKRALIALFALPPAPMIPHSSSSAPIVRVSSKKTMHKDSKLIKSSFKDNRIPAFGFIDVCFCIDSTGSMFSELNQAQSVIQSIIKNIENKVQTQGLQLRFAIVSYRDHPPQQNSYVTQYLDFTGHFEAIEYLKTLTAAGGGDEPEAVHDGLMVSAKNLNWVQDQGIPPVLRYIFHILDAPPHGNEFVSIQRQKGCLCGIQTDDVIRQINKKSIHYRMIKVRQNPNVNKMQKMFQSKIGDFDSTQITHASELNVKVSDMIIHEVLPDYA